MEQLPSGRCFRISRWALLPPTIRKTIALRDVLILQPVAIVSPILAAAAQDGRSDKILMAEAFDEVKVTIQRSAAD